jgi:uncharacterized protein with HEPN domain
MRPDDRIRLQHMLDAALEAMSFSEGHTRADLNSDRKLTLVLVKEIEIIGEAANQIADDSREAIASIPWDDVINMRHRLVHGYFEINLDIVWDTVTRNLPPLIAALEGFLGEEG